MSQIIEKKPEIELESYSSRKKRILENSKTTPKHQRLRRTITVLLTDIGHNLNLSQVSNFK